MDKLRRFFQEKVILSAVMCMLLAVVLVSATYGWYAVKNSTKAYGLELKTGGTGAIKVAIKPGGEDIMSDPQLVKITENDVKIACIPIELLTFSNLEEDTLHPGKSKIAPGAYGPMTFYITSLAENVRSYAIKAQIVYNPVSDQITDDQKKKVEAIINDHITVYQTQYTENGIVKFKDPITYYTKETSDGTEAKGPLEYNVEKKVQLYWVWNYELTDIPNYQSISRFPTSAGNDGETIRRAVRQYDEEDTLLGNCIKDIQFNVYIEGRQGEVKN